ncbi:MAG: twin-arginine translocation signal domain-containing protein [Fimbriimonadaceae bacterium]
MARLSRRDFVAGSGAALLGLAPGPAVCEAFDQDRKATISRIVDPVIRAAATSAVSKNLLAAATETAYPGYFHISADGGAYGDDATWPGLDSWQMAGAYLLLGRTRLVTDYFDFVRASQRKDGNIPFAVFTGDTRPGDTYLRGLKYPADLFTYAPPKRDGLPASSQQTRQWIGLFQHWELRSNPLSTLGPICYVLTAGEIFDATHDKPWLHDHLPSVEAAAAYLSRQIGPNGLMSGSGFYTELPPRDGWDGVTQCYAIHAFRELARLIGAVGRRADAAVWTRRAVALANRFVDAFWREDHFGEYVHIERGLVDSHGLSDTNWAAIAFGVATEHQTRLLWPILTRAKAFWRGGVPTQTVTNPFAYQAWENDPVPFGLPSLTNDVAAMGRVWYLEALACERMGAHDRLVESARLVSLAAKDGFWRERYHPNADGTVTPAGAEKYCEYAAVLARIVLANSKIFCR